MQPAGILNKSYRQDMAVIRTGLQWVLFITFLIFLLCFPLLTTGRILSIMIVIAITCITALGLNIVTGYCGQISLGQAAFMAVGAYTAGILTTKLGLSFWAALPLAGLVASLVGIVFGFPSLRIKGFYLVLTTLAAQIIIIWLINHLPNITGGALGMTVHRPHLGNIAFDSDQSYYYIVIITAIIMTLGAKNIMRTRAGRAFIAIRDNDLAAEVMGINVSSYKLIAFAIAAAYGGIAGCLWGFYTGYLTVENYTLIDSVWYLGMIIIGGMGSVLGSILGPLFFYGLKEVIISILPVLIEWLPHYKYLLSTVGNVAPFALIVILFLIFEPRGLSHRWELLKASYRLWPYSY